MTEPQVPQRERFPLFLGVACAALAVLVVLLTVQNMNLKSKLATGHAPMPGALEVGDTIPAFDLVDATGGKTHVAFEGQGQTLLLVFSSTCGACQDTIPVWNRLLADTTSSPVHVVGIQTDFKQMEEVPASALSSIPDIRFPVFGSADARDELLSKFPEIPVAAMVDGKGSVTGVWIGVPTGAQLEKLRRALAS